MNSKHFTYLLIYIVGMTSYLPSITIADQLQFITPPQIIPNPNPAVPLAALLQIQTNKPAQTHISILQGHKQKTFKYHTPSLLKQELPLIGFSAGQQHQVKVTISDTETTLSKTLSYTAPPLPTAAEAFPIIEIKRFANLPMEAGVTLFNPRRRVPIDSKSPQEQKLKFRQKFGMLAAIDEAGNVIWYYQTDSRISDFELLDNGHIIFLTQDYRVVEIDLLGNTINQWYAKQRVYGEAADATPVDTLTLHHDIDVLPNGNFLVLGSERLQVPNYYTSELDENAPRKMQWVMADEIIEFTPQGDIVWEWKMADYVDVYRLGYRTFKGYWNKRGHKDTIDWSHCNAVQAVDENSILLNSRYQSALFMIDKDSKEIRWIIGEPSGWNENLQSKLFTMQESEWFWHQHGSNITPQGTLLLFDNQNYMARPFNEPLPPKATHSHAVEYQLNIEQKTLKPIWHSRIPDDKSVSSFAMGSVQHLENTGNIFVGYGTLLSENDKQNRTWHNAVGNDSWTLAREYTHEVPAQIVWELQLKPRENDIGLGWTLFGARRISQFP
ncbi:aryl-sulfate sulfotransferase [Candidatus Albibeggiatoa sp. nov. NOAA]|uniref:aryl-sulfate sulfotransferase n=1 Tax=Candidatus Albibeggiatoa sp. nov. NOAA TaxID=3162724 RepID=UPI003301DFA5|nr:aryl-sulfate sulfotransferase [Thiotrichaceae bacterium]